MTIGVITATGTGYPQTGGNRSWLGLITDVARRVGGENDDGRVGAARACCESAVRAYNVILWKFNQTTEDITLVAATDSYTLNSSHAAPLRSYLLDSNSKQIGDPLIWVPYASWLDVSLMEDRSSSDPPAYYTSLNHHKNGTVIFRPVPSAPTTSGYPKVRVVYISRIDIPATDATALNVPQEVEHGIERWAIAEIQSVVYGPGKGRETMGDAVFTKTELESRYRAFPDY